MSEHNEDTGIDMSNIGPLKDLIADAHREMTEIEASRSALNAAANKIRAELVEQGISRRAFSAARQYIKTEEEKRKGFDLAYAIAREAMGFPIQSDLFD